MTLLYSALKLGIVVAGIAFIIVLLPTSPTIPSEILDAITDIVGYIEPWGYLLNFDALFQVVIFVTVFEVIYLGIKILIWVFDKIFDRA